MIDLRIARARIDELDVYWRAADYLGAAQLYLRGNALLREPLAPHHLKERPLGHWGTQPGLNAVYTHLNRLISETGAKIMLVVGPGHGAPAILANLYLEGTLALYEPRFAYGEAGLTHLVRSFSWPGGMPSHVTAMTPGAIHEGGELGYCLSHAYGAALDNPDLLVACIIGDGEAETGPLAASWFCNRFLDPRTSGAVLPILHVNGYKLSGPTVLGRMSDEEIGAYLTGLGYDPLIVHGEHLATLHVDLWSALDRGYARISEIQQRARTRNTVASPCWPVIVLRTEKGITGPAYVDGVPCAGSWHSHGLPFDDPASNAQHRTLLEAWLRSYRPDELFDERGFPNDLVLESLPRPELRMGRNRHTNGGTLLRPLVLPPLDRFAVDIEEHGRPALSATARLGDYLARVFQADASSHTFRLFCPDETTSNKLDAVFSQTDRAFLWPLEPGDEALSPDGRVIEVLSEHTCEGMLEGYILTGRHGLHACYEGFISIVDSMIHQHTKWLKMSRETAWRAPVASLNILLSSHVWRQDHNGFSHQGPGFINSLLTSKGTFIRIYLPPDANTLLCATEHCLQSHDLVNLIIAGKNEMPQWLDVAQARLHCARGASIWDWASTAVDDPEVILASSGDVPTMEALAAITLVRTHVPDLRVRFVNVVDLMTLPSSADHPHGMSDAHFAEIFGTQTPVIFAFHGYPRVLHELLYHRTNPQRFHVRGYEEEGTTTTPFDMVVRNHISRYHLFHELFRRVPRFSSRMPEFDGQLQGWIEQHHAYIVEHGVDVPAVTTWKWSD